jgi:hypothetical protein
LSCAAAAATLPSAATAAIANFLSISILPMTLLRCAALAAVLAALPAVVRIINLLV